MSELFGWLTSLLSFIPGVGQAPPPNWNGYVEADYAYVSAASPGTIMQIEVREGDSVDKGAVLFRLSEAQQRAALAAAEARVHAAEANLDNLLTGSRSEEVDVIRASLAKARVDLSLTQQSLDRSEKLFAQGLIPQAKLDQARAAFAAADAQVTQLEAQLRVAELPARDAQQIAAEANLAAAKADAERAAADLADRTVAAPEAGRIERVFFQVGEMAGMGVPVLSLSAADAMKVKFYLSQTDRAQFSLGEVVSVSCDGCAEGLTAHISYFSSDPQFTPPVIYSRDERNRLVFLVEATMDKQNGILPGQPVSIGLVP